MTFNPDKRKPRLVESKIVKFYVDKFKEKELIETQKIEQEKIEIEQEKLNPNKWYLKIFIVIKKFIFENYGFVIIICLLAILLYIRYVEVQKKKKRLLELQSQ
jgi:hypothetical protein